ncbi:MAG: four-helix bundle copper-binding protein [Acidobacteriota bacterium]|nr:four-helix bundle copper-binding protein [Acidobacteriota bacterium]
MSHERNQEMENCIDNCQSCHEVCLETIAHCLEMGGEHASPAHIKLLQDCVQICQTSADFMIRGSDFHAQTCGVCADICDACAKECESMANGADFMQRCADACRKCAESCRKMSSMSASM